MASLGQFLNRHPGSHFGCPPKLHSEDESYIFAEVKLQVKLTKQFLVKVARESTGIIQTQPSVAASSSSPGLLLNYVPRVTCNQEGIHKKVTCVQVINMKLWPKKLPLQPQYDER